jgi:hypothetical protein
MFERPGHMRRALAHVWRGLLIGRSAAMGLLGGWDGMATNFSVYCC